MKILVSIPNSKKSTRFPGKNKALSHYTIDWLKQELSNIPADWEVEIVEVVSPFTDEICTPYKKFEVIEPDNHQKLTQALQKAFPEHIHVHCQLTNFKRRRGLLVDCINTLLYTKAEVVSTYCSWRNDTSWRELKKLDGKVMFNPYLRSNERKAFYDRFAILCERFDEDI